MHSPVPFFTHSLTALSSVLDKAEAHATAKNIKPDVFPQLRLIADMFPLWRRITKTLAFIATIPPEAYADAEARIITVKAGPRELTFPAMQYYHSFALPNFYFHATTAYNILRSNGVSVGKVDFLGG